MKNDEIERYRHFCYNTTVLRRYCVPYFNTEKSFLVPSFNIEVIKQEKMERFLTLLDNSGISVIADNFVSVENVGNYRLINNNDITLKG